MITSIYQKRNKISEFVKSYSRNALVLGCILHVSDEKYFNEFMSTQDVLLDYVKDMLNSKLKEEGKPEYTSHSAFKLSYDKEIENDNLVYLYLTIPTTTIFTPSSQNSLFMNSLGIAFENAVVDYIKSADFNDSINVYKSAESLQHIKEDVNIGGKTVKLFRDFTSEQSNEIYNFYGCFGVLYLSDTVSSLVNTEDEKTYISAIENFQQDMVNAVNRSLDSLGITDIKLEKHPVSKKYSLQPKEFKFKGFYRDNPTDEYLDAIDNSNDYMHSREESINYDSIAKSAISLLKSKYSNFGDLFMSYCRYFIYDNSNITRENLVKSFAEFIQFDFTYELPSFATTFDKKVFYEQLTGTDSTEDSDRDVILDTFYSCYNDTLSLDVVGLSKFEGKYSDYIAELTRSDLTSAKQNSSSKFYFNTDNKGIFIGVNVCLTDETIQDARNKLITRKDTKRLCDSFLKQLCKN